MSAPKPILTSPFCSKLRSKKWFFLEGPALREEDLMDASNDCWCGATQQKVGPDGAVVDPEDCQSARRCFEPQGRPAN